MKKCLDMSRYKRRIIVMSVVMIVAQAFSLCLLSGCRKKAEVAFGKPVEIDHDRICAYIEDNHILVSSGGEVYSAVEFLGYDDTHIYIYAHIAEYFWEGESLIVRNRTLLPMALGKGYTNGQVTIKGYSVPSNGTEYRISMEEIFPDEIINKISKIKDFSYLEALSDQRATENMQ